MKAKLRGEKELQKELERRYGKKRMQKVTDDALVKGGKKVASIIRKDMMSVRKTGKSARATSVSNPIWIGGTRAVKIHWDDGTGRYRIIHLNEYGHYDKAGKWVNPSGKGVIENALRQGRDVYFAEVKAELQRRL